MERWLLTFFIGAILSLFFAEVPDTLQLFLLFCIAVFFYQYKKSRSSSGLWFGALWVLTQAHLYHNQLPDTIIDLIHEKQLMAIEGEVLTLQVNMVNSAKVNTSSKSTSQVKTSILNDAKNSEKPTTKVKKNVKSHHSNTSTKRFNLLVSKINNQQLTTPVNIRLSWQKASFDVAQGQTLYLNVKLKPIHGLSNIGSFNYVSWLKAHSIVATGYVVNPRKKKAKHDTKSSSTIKSTKENRVVGYSLTSRQHLFEEYHNIVPKHELTPILLALAFGERSLLTTEHWDILQATGTSHLIAISGLHIGLLASSVFILVMIFLRYLPFRNNRWQQLNVRYFAIGTSLLFATAYAYLAGFSLPTQRALVMLNLYWLSRAIGINFRQVRLVLLTVFIILIISPFSIITASFWLSFYAVVIIFATLWRFNYLLMSGNVLWRFVKGVVIIQIALTAMLLPITAVFFQKISLVSLVANIVAVPWMSTVSIPTALISVLATPLNDSLAQWFMGLSLQSLSLLWQYLELLSQWEYAIISLSLHEQMLVVLIISILGINTYIVGYVPKFRLAKRTEQQMLDKQYIQGNEKEPIKYGIYMSLSVAIIVYLLCRFYSPNIFLEPHSLPNNKNNEGNFKSWQAVFFDVGQGLSVLIKRNGRAILYDTGAAYPSGFTMSDAVILPYLQYAGINKLDKVILSHSDNDHAGGLGALTTQIRVDSIVSNDSGIIHIGEDEALFPENIGIAQTSCEPTQSFEWQGLRFRYLWPLVPNKTSEASGRVKQKNDDSCVVLISDSKGRTLLLPGDISLQVERELITLHPQLTANVVQVPHHGSKTSSSREFIQQLSPQIAVVSAGFLNRWNMPVPTVSQRYTDLNVQLLNNAELGQIIMTFDESGITTRSYVDDLRPFWFSH